MSGYAAQKKKSGNIAEFFKIKILKIISQQISEKNLTESGKRGNSRMPFSTRLYFFLHKKRGKKQQTCAATCRKKVDGRREKGDEVGNIHHREDGPSGSNVFLRRSVSSKPKTNQLCDAPACHFFLLRKPNFCPMGSGVHGGQFDNCCCTHNTQQKIWCGAKSSWWQA